MHIKIIISIVCLVVAGFAPAPSTMAATTPAKPLRYAHTYNVIQPITPTTATELPRLEPMPYPVAPQGTYSSTYDFGNCTAYVAGRKSIPNSWGNANTWDDRAAAQGLTVAPTPVIGAIAQSDGGGYGHVAIVTATGPGQVLVTEMNVRGLNVVDETWYPVGHFRYIYI